MKQISRKIIRNCSGQAHVEIILSFVIFVSMVIFILAVFKPFDLLGKADIPMLEIVERAVFNRVSIEIAVMPLRIASSVPAEPNSFSFPSNMHEVIARDENSERISAKSESEILSVARSGSLFYRLYFSDEFAESEIIPAPNYELGAGEYTLGEAREYEVISNSSIESLFSEYSADYNLLKSNLGIEYDFSMIVRDGESIMLSAESSKPSGVEIQSREFPITLIDKKGDITYAIFNIQVW